jgi:hypothetical protein
VLAGGSCGFTNSDNSIPFPIDAVAAASDGSDQYAGDDCSPTLVALDAAGGRRACLRPCTLTSTPVSRRQQLGSRAGIAGLDPVGSMLHLPRGQLPASA